jgi:hypothetical protein
MKNVFDWLKAINSTKPPVESFTDKDWEVWNSYMIHRFLSMNPNYIDLVNEVQKSLPQNKREIYSIYKEFIPKNNKWNKYIKSSVKQPNKDLSSHIKDHFECSSKEAREYITLLDTPQISRILSNRGLNTKEIKTILK